MKAIEQDVRNEANAAAENANKLPPENTAQPKAKSAVKASERLISESFRLAQSAQRLQMTRLPMQAKQMMLLAMSTMQKAQMMREWADKLYAQAQRVNESLGAYPAAEST